MSFRVYIAEDEPLAREALVAMFEPFARWRLAGVAEDGERALKDCRENPPDFLLTDIKMPLLDGLDLVAALKESAPQIHCAFITAHENHALQAFRLAAVDYLLKPVTSADFRACLERVEQRLLLEKPAQKRFLEVLLVKSVGRIDVVRAHEVLAFRATGNYVEVTTRDQTHLHRQTIKTLVEELDPASFVQTHRSVIVAGRAVRALEHDEILLENGQRFPVSARYRPEVEKFLSRRA